MFKVDNQSLLTSENYKKLIQHIELGGNIRSGATLIGVTRKTIYYWMRKYSEFAFEIEQAEGRLLMKYEYFLFAGAVGLDISHIYPNFNPEYMSIPKNYRSLKKQAKRRFPAYFNRRTKGFRKRVEEEKALS